LNHLAGPKDNSTRSGKFEAGYLKQICMTELLADLTFDLAKFNPLMRVSPRFRANGRRECAPMTGKAANLRCGLEGGIPWNTIRRS
jgi:hypothetical protein